MTALPALPRYTPAQLWITVALAAAFSATLGSYAQRTYAPRPAINPDLIKTAAHICRNNDGPRLIQPLRGSNLYDIRCTDGALFDSQLIELSSDTPGFKPAKVAGAELMARP